MNLQQDIDAFVAQTAGRVPAEFATALQTSIDTLRDTGIASRTLHAGDLAPQFTLPNALGQPVSVGDLLQRGPVIISFYRGIWCPYCNLELRAYQRILGDVRAAGGDFIAISPQTPDRSLATATKNGLAFEVLSDRGNRVAAQFGIAYATPEIVRKITMMFGADIAAINGDDGETLPIAATYVVDRDRRIALAHVDADFRVRLEPEDALEVLRGIGTAPVGTAATKIRM